MEPGSFIILPRDVLERSDLTSTAKLAYGVLLDRVGDNGECWPGQRRIAKDIGASLTAAHRSVAELRRADLIAIEHPKALTGPRRMRTCRYRIRSRKLNVRDSMTLSNRQGERTRNDNANVRDSITEPNQGNSPKGTKPKKKARGADSWEAVCGAMTSSILKTDSFREAWGRWTTYRSEIRKALKPSTIKAQVRKLESFGCSGAVTAIDRSIEQGWTGLFPPDTGRGGRRTALKAPKKIEETIPLRVLN